MQKQIDAVPTAVMKGLMSWDWPGNIRELENFIERAVLLTKGRSLDAPLAELRKTSTNRPHDDLHEMKQVAQQDTESESDKSSVTDKYVRKQRDEIV